MNKLTPSEVRKRKQQTKRFDENWVVDVATSEIKLRPLKPVEKIISYLWKKKFKVSDLYWWSSWRWYQWDLMPQTDAIKHDDIPIKGFPRKHQLINNWSIPNKDLKFLYDGPLIDASGKILVKHQNKLQMVVSIISQLKPLSWIIGFILLCTRYWNEIIVIVDNIKKFI